MLLALDTVRWGNTLVMLIMAGAAANNSGRLILTMFIGRGMPTVFAIIAASFVEAYEAFEFASRKNKRKKKKRGVQVA